MTKHTAAYLSVLFFSIGCIVAPGDAWRTLGCSLLPLAFMCGSGITRDREGR